MNKIIVSGKQLDTVNNLLRESDGSDDESLIQSLIKQGGLSEDESRYWVTSWRYWHPDGGVVVRGKNRDNAIVIESDGSKASSEYEKNWDKMKGTTTKRAPVEGAPAPLEGMGKIQAIIRLHEQGYSNAQIIAAGYSKSTVSRQVGEHLKRKKQAN